MKKSIKKKNKAFFCVNLIIIFCIFGIFYGRFIYFSIVQEGRFFSLVPAALKISLNLSEVEIIENGIDSIPLVILAYASMERIDGDWPSGKFLENYGLRYKEEIENRVVYSNSNLGEIVFEKRIGKEMMILKRLEINS
ncbi:MAG TPA: hypothetical protein PKA63_14650 [Oligoflexia bacterium]|nr:hypothetical protein [Oligoflexia bacterium]HMP49905.1 hypothetical protein [Oligoflexia bacterium]